MAGQAAGITLLVLPWSPDWLAGVSVVVTRLQAEFERQRAPSAIVVSDWAASAPATGADGHRRFRFSLVGAPSLAGMLRTLVHLPRRLARTRRLLRGVDIVNFHYVNLDPIGAVLLKRVGLYRGRLVLSFHGTDVRAPVNAIERGLWQFMLASADAVTACSASLARQLVATHGGVCKGALTIPNGVDTAVFRPGLPRPADLPQRYLVSVGSYLPRKGHRSLLQAFARIADEQPDLHLVIVGQDGPERAALLQLAHELQLAARVQCRIDVPHSAVAGIVANAVAGVQPSLAEPFGIAVIEAGACGIPVVASAVGGHVELLLDGETGYLFAAADVDACAAALRRVLNDAAGAAVVAERLRRVVGERYTWAVCAGRYAAAAHTARHR